MQKIKEQEILNIFNSKNEKPSIIQENIPLKDKNWFGTGGNARYYTEPKNAIEFAEAVKFANDNNLPIFVLGQGANILISDDGFDGLVIRPFLKEITIELNGNNHLVKAGCAVDFQNLINFCLDNELIGLEEFSGIPGTVGGSVYINIHYFEFLLSNFLTSATVFDKCANKTIIVDHSWFNFGYNISTLQNKNYFLIDASFKLTKVDHNTAQYHKGRSFEIIRHRSKRYPNQRTCGSFFRNFYEHEVSFESAGKKLIYVAYYLDKIGVKGNLRFGDAIVSYQHANMLVNLNNATSNDIINLARQMQILVKENFNIVPQPECQLIGFKDYPLL